MSSNWRSGRLDPGDPIRKFLICPSGRHWIDQTTNMTSVVDVGSKTLVVDVMLPSISFTSRLSGVDVLLSTSVADGVSFSMVVVASGLSVVDVLSSRSVVVLV